MTTTGNTRLRAQGTGTVQFTGGSAANESTIYSLQSFGSNILLDGAHIHLSSNSSSPAALWLINGGDVTIQNGSVIRAGGSMTQIDNGTLTITGSGTSHFGALLHAPIIGDSTPVIIVEDGASFELTTELAIGAEGNAVLTVQSGASAVLDTFLLGVNGSGDALVTGTGSFMSANSLKLGFFTPGEGMLTVNDGASVDVSGQIFFDNGNSSITIDGGTLEAGRMRGGTGHVVSITDPVGQTALTVGTNNGSATYDGVIQNASGAGSLIKTGTGSFTLTGSNTYTGSTIIDGGKLMANNATGSATGTGNVTMESGTTLGGFGAIGGTVVVNDGGTIAPGASAGILTVNEVVLLSGSTSNVELAGNGGVAGTDFD